MVECVNLRKKYMTVTAVEDISLNSGGKDVRAVRS